MALRGPNGLNPLCVLGQKSKFMKSWILYFKN
jgi:hypothetical protein